MTIPQRIVSYHVSSFGKMSQRHFVILNIFTFITVNKSQIKRNAQTIGIKAFNDLVAKDERVEKVILPLRDGLTIIRKK